jgi:acyl dehydratase
VNRRKEVLSMDVARRGLFFEEFEQGMSFKTRSRTITEADIVAFAGLSGDFNPLHTDEEFAKTTPHGRRIAHGMLSASIASGLAAQAGLFDGTTLALISANTKFTGVVYPGDTIQLEMVVKGKRKDPDGNRGLVMLKTALLNQRDEIVSEGLWTLLLKSEKWEDGSEDSQ